MSEYSLVLSDADSFRLRGAAAAHKEMDERHRELHRRRVCAVRPGLPATP